MSFESRGRLGGLPDHEDVDRSTVPVVVLLPGGKRRPGKLQTWRNLLIWKELAAADDLDELGQNEGWWWCHAHVSEVEWEYAAPRGPREETG